MAIQESYVKVKEVVVKTPSASQVSSNSNIAGVIVAPTGPKLAYITSPSEFLANYTRDGQTIPRNADVTFINAYYLSYNSGLVLVRSINTDTVGGIAVKADGSTKNILYKGDQILNGTAEMSFKIAKDAQGKEPDWSIAIGNYGFYRENSTDVEEYTDDIVEVDSINELGSVIESLDDFHATCNVTSEDSNYINVTLTLESNSISPIEVKPFRSITMVSPSSADSHGIYSVTPTDINADSDDWLFTIKGDIALSTDDHVLGISNSDPGNGDRKSSFVLTLDTESADKNGKYNQYLVSLDPDMTDTNGVNYYIEYLNTQDLGFEVTVLNSTDSEGHYLVPANSAQLAHFGASGLDLKACKNEANIKAALDYLADQEIYDIEYLAPLGLTQVSVIQRLQVISRNNKWFCPIDVPANCTTYTAVKRFGNDYVNSTVYFNSDNEIPGSILLGPFDKNSSLTGWNNYIAASTLYFERVMANKGQNAEFAPVFKNTYGAMNYTNPTKLFLKSEREKLLSQEYPINWAVYDQRSLSYYMNDNRTRINDQTSVVCEEQNSRIVWKISKDIDKLLDQFISQYNTKATRARVVDVLTYYFNWSIMNQQFAPDDYEVICDDTINPPEVINANKLAVIVKVRLYKAIKYIEVVNKVYPLGVDFNQSI